MSDMSSAVYDLEVAIRDLLELREMVKAASDYQWQRPPSPPRVAERAPAGVRVSADAVAASSRQAVNEAPGDPTGDTVADPARLVLRRKVTKLEQDARLLRRATLRLRTDLQAGLRPYVGGQVLD